MRTSVVGVLLCLIAGVMARWSNQDYEIFDVDRALKTAEGVNTTFYSFLNISSRATTDEVSRAYRKLSLTMHPDKNIGVPNAQKRFERLGLIVKMLRTPEVRERYDHFYNNGFPAWKGTGYYYSRYRPGLGAVLGLLFFVIAGFHYLAIAMAARSHKGRIQAHIDDAYAEAGYAKGIARTKRVQSSHTGRVFDVEPSGQVYFVPDPSSSAQSQRILLDLSQVPPASFSRSLLVRIPVVLYRVTIGRFISLPPDNLDDQAASSAHHNTDREIIHEIKDAGNRETIVTPSGNRRVKSGGSNKKRQ